MEKPATLKCVIVDDEPIAVEGLKQQINTLNFLTLSATFHDAIEARTFLELNKVDLIFLDINMPHLSGPEMISSLSSKPLIIVTSGHQDCAFKSLQLDAVDYLLKPFSFERLSKAVNKALLLWREGIQHSND